MTMQAKHWLTLRVLLNHFHEGIAEALIRALPQEHVDELQKIEVTSGEISPLIDHPFDEIKKIHYSWLLPAVEKLPKQMQEVTVSALPEPYSTRIRRSFQFPPAPKTLPLPIKKYLIKTLYDKVKKTGILPLEYLPDSPHKELVDLSKSQIVELVDFLGIHDLATEVRQIVDKRQLQMVYKCLSPLKRRFLDVCLQRKDRMTSPKLKLQTWGGDCKTLNKRLHKRGLKRLGYALAGQDSNLIWHLAHKLDTGRGKLLMKYYKKKEITKVTPLLTQEVLQLVKFLKQKRMKA